jgi:fibronectin type 3 domain-containing protein
VSTNENSTKKVNGSRRNFIKSTATITGASLLSSPLLLVTDVLAQTKNVTRLENAKSGTTAWELSNPAWQGEIEGYASLTSVNRGGSISLFVSTSAPSYTVDVYRIGWYGGAGGRQVYGPVTRTGLLQPTPTIEATGLVDCSWTNPLVINVPENTSDPTDWASGIYLAKLTAGTSGPQSYIVFTVLDNSRSSDYIFLSAVNTWQAYNAWGGKSLYAFNSTNQVPAQKVSFNRPYDRNFGSGDFTGMNSGIYGGWEINMLRFLEREGYDVAYATSIDLHEQGLSLFSHYKAIIINGHDEYWSYAMRSALQQARDEGKNIGFFGANAIYWQIRFEPSNSGVANRTVVAYKESARTSDPYSSSTDVSVKKYTTARWRDLVLSPYNIVDPVAQPENAVVGIMYHGDPFDGDIVVSDATSWIYAGTGISNGYHFAKMLGYETDSTFSNGFAPAGLQTVAKSPDNWGYAYMSLYPTSAGGVVFATGSMWWAYGLDDYNVPGQRTSCLNPNAQQVTRNILARFVSSSAPAAAPATPTQLTATAGSAGIALTWAASTGATSYNVFRSQTSGGEGTVPYSSNISSTAYTDKAVSAGSTYYYQVSAVNSVGQSAPSAEASAMVQAPATAPATPTQLTATAGSASIALTWAASTGATSYNVLRSQTPGGEGTVPYASNISATTYTDKGVSAGTTYYYQVSAVNSAGQSAPSSEASAIVQPATAPTAPTNLAASQSGGSANVKLTWVQSPSPGIVSNNIYRSVNGEAYQKQASISTTSSYNDQRVSKKTVYSYQVTAVDSNGLESQRSLPASVTTK